MHARAHEIVERVLSELPEAPDRARAQVEALGGLERVGDAARAFGLGPLLAHLLRAEVLLSKSGEISARFAAARLERLTRATLAQIESAGIRAVVLKGLGLAARLYPERWLRPSVDVDILVEPSKITEAMAAVTRAGWRRAGELPQTRLEYAKDIAFAGRAGEQLELHFGFNSDFQARIDTERLLRRAVRCSLGDGDIPVLSRADDLLVQCVHAAHHAFQGAKWLFDLKLSIRAGGFAWAELVSLARHDRVAAAVGMALSEAARRVNAEVPRWVLHALGPSASRQRIARTVLRAENPDISSLLASVLLADRLSWRLAEEAIVRPAGRIVTRAGFGRWAKRAAKQVAGHVVRSSGSVIVRSRREGPRGDGH